MSGWEVAGWRVEFRICHNYSTWSLLRVGRAEGPLGGHISGTFRLVGWPNNTGMGMTLANGGWATL